MTGVESEPKMVRNRPRSPKTPTSGKDRFRDLRNARGGQHVQLALETPNGRGWHLDRVFAAIRDVLTPTGGGMLHRPSEQIGLDQADVVVESADRVLWMDFWFSD